MSIKFALLGLIAEQPMHGYRLKEIFDERMSPMWGLTTAQIYQTLGVLQRGGLLESRGERVGSRPERRTYCLTDAGKRELARWLQETPSPSTKPFRADLLLRLMFLRECDIDGLFQALERLEHETRHSHTRVTQMPRSPVSSGGSIDIVGLFLDGMAHHLDADLKMIARCREEVERWIQSRPMRASKPPSHSLASAERVSPRTPGSSRTVTSGSSPSSRVIRQRRSSVR